MRNTIINRYDNGKIPPSKLWENLHYVGLDAIGVPAVIKELMFGGIASLQTGDAPIPGEIRLVIKNGGIRNYGLSKNANTIFKKIVKPILLSELPHIEHAFSGILQLHFGESKLRKIELTIN